MAVVATAQENIVTDIEELWFVYRLVCWAAEISARRLATTGVSPTLQLQLLALITLLPVCTWYFDSFINNVCWLCTRCYIILAVALGLNLDSFALLLVLVS